MTSSGAPPSIADFHRGPVAKDATSHLLEWLQNLPVGEPTLVPDHLLAGNLTSSRQVRVRKHARELGIKLRTLLRDAEVWVLREDSDDE